MNTDIFFTQGSTHKVCQDYAISNRRDKDGLITGRAFAIVCDGCSGAEDSDFGARVLARAALRHQDRFLSHDQRLNRILTTADMYRQSLALPVQSLCSTLLMAVETGDSIEVTVVGDGVVFARKRDGTGIIYEYRYPSGAPYYLRYALSSSDEAEYGEIFGWKRQEWVHEFLNGKIEFVKMNSNDTTPNYEESALSIMPVTRTFKTSEYDLVAIMSDGTSAFERFQETATGREPHLISLADVLREVTAFKNYNGEFVQRRCQKAFEKFRKDGWQNTDDFSIGAIYIGKLEA